jgi:hypothetical protein
MHLLLRMSDGATNACAALGKLDRNVWYSFPSSATESPHGMRANPRLLLGAYSPAGLLKELTPANDLKRWRTDALLGNESLFGFTPPATRFGPPGRAPTWRFHAVVELRRHCIGIDDFSNRMKRNSSSPETNGFFERRTKPSILIQSDRLMQPRDRDQHLMNMHLPGFVNTSPVSDGA